MTNEPQVYDPYILIDEVVALLTERGLTPQRDKRGSGERMQAACMLLNNLGIEPSLAPEYTPDLDGHMNYNRRVHGD
jgi:hypothetical protein